MAQPGRQARPHFSQPIRQIFLMLMVIVLSGFGAFLALPQVLPVFQANPYLNGFIVFVFAIGVVAHAPHGAKREEQPHGLIAV